MSSVKFKFRFAALVFATALVVVSTPSWLETLHDVVHTFQPTHGHAHDGDHHHHAHDATEGHHEVPDAGLDLIAVMGSTPRLATSHHDDVLPVVAVFDELSFYLEASRSGGSRHGVLTSDPPFTTSHRPRSPPSTHHT